ncbi:hypothetical protein MMC31_006716 [Peltigera leucophlebia]|nr:hypothetical protein [Peltigera leucophlebia]
MSLSHGEMRNSLQAISDILKKSTKAQEECLALQAARLEFVNKAGKGVSVPVFKTQSATMDIAHVPY